MPEWRIGDDCIDMRACEKQEEMEGSGGEWRMLCNKSAIMQCTSFQRVSKTPPLAALGETVKKRQPNSPVPCQDSSNMRAALSVLTCCILLQLLQLGNKLYVNGAGVMGIDYGTDWYKIALVKPGVPLEIVLNRDSKRKTEASVAIRDSVRYFGSESIHMVCVFTATQL